MDSWNRTDAQAHRPPQIFASSRLSHRAIRRQWVRTLNSVIYVSLQWTRRRSERTIKQCRREKRSFLHTLILGNKKQTSPKKYRTLISLILLGHMQKISHFWAKMKKDPKCQLGRFCPEPFNCFSAIWYIWNCVENLNHFFKGSEFFDNWKNSRLLEKWSVLLRAVEW